MNETVLFCAYKSVLCEGMTLETQYLGSRPTRACELKFYQIALNQVSEQRHALCRRKCKTQKNDTQNAKNSKKIGE